MKKIVILTSFQLILLSFNCPAQQTTNANLEEAKKAIAASNELFFQAFTSGDSSLLVHRFTTDCWIMPPNTQTLCGIDAPIEFFKTAYNQLGVRNGKFISIDVFGDAVTYVTEVGFYQLSDANTNPLDNGKFLVLWKKTSDGWKMFRDSFSSDRGK